MSINPDLFIFLLSILISVIARLIFISFIKKKTINNIFGDASIHYKIIKEIKKNGLKNFHVHNYIIPGKIFSPILFHLFSSLFPVKNLECKPYLPNLIIYIIFLLYLSTYSFYLFSEISSQPFILSAYVVFLFTISMNNFIFRGSQINYVLLSERLLGRLITSSFVLSIFGFYLFDNLLNFLLSYFFAILIFISSKFAIQSIVFFTIILSILNINLSPIILLLLALISASLISKGYAFRSFKNTFIYLSIYKKFITNSRFKKPLLNTYLDLNTFFQVLKFKNLTASLKYFFSNEPGRSILSHFDLFLILPLLIYFIGYDSIISNNFFILKILLACIIPYLLISNKYLSFAGESYRYLEYLLTFLIPILIVYLSLIHMVNINFILILFLFLFIFSIFFRFNFVNNKENHNLNEEINRKYLNEIIIESNITSKDIIFSVDMRLGTEVAARTNCKTFWWQPGGLADKNIFSYFIEEYPFLSSKNFEKIYKKYLFTKIIINNDLYKTSGIKYDFKNFLVINYNKYYTVYKHK